MSFDSIFRDNEDGADVLDQKFLGGYSGYGRSTVSLDNGSNDGEYENEDEGESEIDFFGVSLMDRADEDKWERLVAESDAQERSDEAGRIAIAETKRLRREYQKRYRCGLILPKHAAVFQRLDGLGEKENRKKLVYYLTPDFAASVREATTRLGLKRREFVKTALETYFLAKPTSKNFKTKRQGSEVVFQYDEIPEVLWDKVNRLCHNASGERVANHYQVVERALKKALAS